MKKTYLWPKQRSVASFGPTFVSVRLRVVVAGGGRGGRVEMVVVSVRLLCTVR